MEAQKSITSICFVAGRSGGHILPALALAQQEKKEYPAGTTMLFTTNAPLDLTIVQKSSNIDRHIILQLDNVPGSPFGYPKFFWHFIKSFWQSFKILREQRPKKVISTGGYIALPVCFAARLLRIPIELFELNAHPGQATSFLAPLATKILHCFEKARLHLPEKKCELSTYPVRFDASAKATTIQMARIKVGLNPFKKTILILGGSQGSLFINMRMKEIINAQIRAFATYQIIHQTGEHDETDWESWYQDRGIQARIFAYYHDMEYVYQAASIIVCRSGAGTLFEALFFEKRCITIPLETATNTHQVDNAYALALQYPYHIMVLQQKEILAEPALLSNGLLHYLCREDVA